MNTTLYIVQVKHSGEQIWQDGERHSTLSDAITTLERVRNFSNFVKAKAKLRIIERKITERIIENV